MGNARDEKKLLEPIGFLGLLYDHESRYHDHFHHFVRTKKEKKTRDPDDWNLTFELNTNKF